MIDDRLTRIAMQYQKQFTTEGAEERKETDNMPKEQREPIDRKFTFCATCCEHGHEHSHQDAMVFLAKDKLLPDTLRYYQNRCQEEGASVEQLQCIGLLIERVVRYQAEHPELVKVADVSLPDTAGILDPNES